MTPGADAQGHEPRSVTAHRADLARRRLHDAGSALGKRVYCAINVALVIFGAASGRRVFTIFGALGVTGFLGDLFRDSLVFPSALCLSSR